MSNLYEILELDPSATQDEIKNKYYKLAKKYHPDKNQFTCATKNLEFENKFKEISAAYSILSNPSERIKYDLCMNKGDGQFNINSIAKFFGENGFYFKTKNDIEINIKVKLEELYLGVNKRIKLNNKKNCTSCEGKGFSDPFKNIICEFCNNFDGKNVQKNCSNCNGDKYTIPVNNFCMDCNGNKIVTDTEIISFHISKGTQIYEKIIIKKENKNIVVSLELINNEIYERTGNDLTIKKKITLFESIVGFSFSITHLDGKEIIISTLLGEITHPGQIRIIKGKGMPKKKTQDYGDLYINMDVEYPDQIKMSKNDLNNLENIFGEKKHVEGNLDKVYYAKITREKKNNCYTQ